MASTVIHMCVAKEIGKKLGRKSNDYYIGSIAPDLAKIIGMHKNSTHFYEGDIGIPDMTKFVNKYKNNLNNDFILGYYIHLYTDYLWEKYFMSDFTSKDMIELLNGEKVKLTNDEFYKLVYNDYTDLNKKLIDFYNLDLDLFFNENNDIETTLDEIPLDKIQLLIDKAGLIIANAGKRKNYVFNIDHITKFINTSALMIFSEIEKETNSNNLE